MSCRPSASAPAARGLSATYRKTILSNNDKPVNPQADHDFNEQELELKTNTQLTREIDRLTTELHSRLLGNPAGGGH
jgi:hypothetical protein